MANAGAADTNVHAFQDALKAAVERAESRVALVSAADAKSKAGRLALVDESLREVAALRRAFHGEMQLLRPQEKAAFRLVLDGIDKRVQNVEERAQRDGAGGKASTASPSSTAPGPPAPPAPTSNDAMLSETEKVQSKTTNSLRRILTMLRETRALGHETAQALHAQTHQISHVDAHMSSVDAELKRANRSISSIARRS